MSCFRFLIAGLALLALAACSRPMDPAAFRQTPEAMFLLDTVARLQQHDYAAVSPRVDPGLAAQLSQAGLEHAAQALPAGPVQDLQPVALEVEGGAGGALRLATVAAELHFAAAGPVLVTARLAGEPGHFGIRGFYIEPLEAPLAETHALGLKGKSAWQIGFALLSLAVFAFTLWTLLYCLRRPGLPRKALWSLFTLLGAMTLSVDWSSGVFALNPLSLSVFNVALIRQGWLGPWTLSCSFPLGALVFWVHQRILILRARRAGSPH